MNGDEPDLVAFAVDSEVHDALAALQIAQAQQTKFLPAHAVIEQCGENRAVPYTLQRVRGRGLEKSSNLRIAERRRAALAIIRGWPLHAVYRIAEDGVALAEIIEKR